MCPKNVFEKIEELYPQYIKIWEDVSNIESPTNYKAGVDEVGKYFTKMAEKKGWQVEISNQKTAGNALCITMNPDSAEAPVCFSGHLDTVHPLGLFPTPAVSMDNEKIYGPGVFDCKGGCVASFMAMDALQQSGFNKRPIKLILQSDEETGSKTSDKKTVEFMVEKSKDAIAFFNTEPNNPGTATMQRKGILRFRFKITGKAVHSSLCDEGANAVTEAAYKIIELEKMKNPEGLTCNCGVIEGGTVANTVAEKCSFLADIRFATAKEEEQVRNLVEEISQKSTVKGCVCELKQVSYRPAMVYSQKNLSLLETLNKIYADAGLETLKPAFGRGGSDAAYITQADIPCIDSIGVQGGEGHSIKEYSYLRSLATSAKYLASAALGL